MGAYDFKADLSKVDKGILNSIADLTNVPDGAFNIRKNGQGVVRHSCEHI